MVDTVRQLAEAKTRIAELEAHIESLQNRHAQRTAELESAVAAFEEWASPLVNGDDGCGVWYGQGLPQIVTQARAALFAAKAPTKDGQ